MRCILAIFFDMNTTSTPCLTANVCGSNGGGWGRGRSFDECGKTRQNDTPADKHHTVRCHGTSCKYSCALTLGLLLLGRLPRPAKACEHGNQPGNHADTAVHVACNLTLFALCRIDGQAQSAETHQRQAFIANHQPFSLAKPYDRAALQGVWIGLNRREAE